MTNRYEKRKLAEGYSHVIGCDEVGRGSLAGPVVAAAVILPAMEMKSHALWKEINDSKQLTAEKREELAAFIKENAVWWSISEVSHQEIDEVNIHNASLLAMKKAVESLRLSELDKTFIYIDGKFLIPSILIEQEAVVAGDGKVISIAAASIIAKVYRDDLMRNLDISHPEYNFAQHKGYATRYHREAIAEHGLSPIHRLTFCGHLA